MTNLLEKYDRRTITINNKWDANIKTHYKKDTYITWFTQDGLRPHINCQSFIIIPSNKMKGYNLQQPRCTFSSHSHIITEIVYNATIQYTTILQWFPFIGELPWENTTGHPIPWVWKQLANKHPKNFFRGISPQLGWLYSKNGVPTQMNNNISESRRLGSKTNSACLQFDSIFHSSIWWTTMWKVPNHLLMLIEQFLNVFGI